VRLYACGTGASEDVEATAGVFYVLLERFKQSGVAAAVCALAKRHEAPPCFTLACALAASVVEVTDR